MPVFNIQYTIGEARVAFNSYSIEVEADTKEEAIELVRNRPSDGDYTGWSGDSPIEDHEYAPGEQFGVDVVEEL